jgi:hypothetical protein
VNEESVNGFFSSGAEFVSRARAKGYRWMTMQVNDGTWGAEQRAKVPEYRVACAGQLPFTIWLTRPFDAAFARQMAVESQCQGILLEGEIPGDRPEAVNWPEVILYLQDLDIAKGIVTNFAPFFASSGAPMFEKARPLIAAGYACVTECFVTESPNSTPANQDFLGKQIGWPRTQPMIEGWHLADYGDMSGYQNVSHWDAGNVL